MSLLELLLPKACGGCGRGGHKICPTCQTALQHVPYRCYPPIDIRIPVFALSPYAGAHRNIILGMKERGRHDLIAPMGRVINTAVHYLSARGELPETRELVLVPAPTTKAAMRQRGIDPVRGICQTSNLPWRDCVMHSAAVKDSVGLDAAARRRNLAAGVQLHSVPQKGTSIVLIDDVVTTGATLEATTMRLWAAGCEVAGALVICSA